jgi:metal-responsive CopG/Arc/MetJ family transcriptional regulator
MATAKFAVSMDKDLLAQLDRLVKERRFPSRSQAVQAAVKEKLLQLKQDRLRRECSKLDPAEEQRFADADLNGDLAAWPEY